MVKHSRLFFCPKGLPWAYKSVIINLWEGKPAARRGARVCDRTQKSKPIHITLEEI